VGAGEIPLGERREHMKLEDLTNPIIVCSYCGRKPAVGLYHRRSSRQPWLSPMCLSCAVQGRPETQRYGDVPEIERGGSA
jgi:hypothetical protein